MDDVDLANLVRNDEIDILIELSGHTGGNRLRALSGRPAPVQMTYLGYPITTGADYVDYWISDHYAHASDDHLHTEKLLRLPESFLCFGSFEDIPIKDAPPMATNGFVTFGSFNNLRKLSPATVYLWSRLLLAVPDSRLFLKDSLLQGRRACENLMEAFMACGIDRSRLQIETQTPTREEHFNLYGKMDIALDPIPYNGTTTTCDALWMGVPVLTLVGQSHRQRVSYSILKNIGVEDTIAWSEDEYVQIAVRLSKDLGGLSDLRRRVARNIRSSILCDPARFTRQFEAALTGVWEEYLARVRSGAA
jgi:predicted O-linked N-acetylglucosamine transferase (SPINDLY family)